MIIDVTGIELIPGEKGIHCPGNGTHKNSQGSFFPAAVKNAPTFCAVRRTTPKWSAKHARTRIVPVPGETVEEKSSQGIDRTARQGDFLKASMGIFRNISLFFGF